MGTAETIIAICAVLGALLGGGGVLGIAVTWGRVRQKIETIEERNRRLTMQHDQFQEMHMNCVSEQRARYDRIIEKLGGLETEVSLQGQDFKRFLDWAYKNGHLRKQKDGDSHDDD